MFVTSRLCILLFQQNIAYFHNQQKEYYVFGVLKGSNKTELLPFIEFLRDRRLKKHVF